MKGLLIHVASDHSTKPYVCGPIWRDDSTFEFIPIVESDDHAVAKKYTEISTRFQFHGAYLSDLVPQEYESSMAHFDPDLRDHNGTYGEPYGSMRGSEIARLAPGDYLFFVASLAPYEPEAYKFRHASRIRSYQRGKMRKAIIGYFQVAGVYYVEKSENKGLVFEENAAPENQIIERIQKNAHSQRPKDEFLVAVASDDPVFLSHAVILTEAGSPFRPSQVGSRIYGELSFPRGFKRLGKEQVQTTLELCHGAED
jgi:hypothetical protein